MLLDALQGKGSVQRVSSMAPTPCSPDRRGYRNKAKTGVGHAGTRLSHHRGAVVIRERDLGKNSAYGPWLHSRALLGRIRLSAGSGLRLTRRDVGLAAADPSDLMRWDFLTIGLGALFGSGGGPDVGPRSERGPRLASTRVVHWEPRCHGPGVWGEPV